LKEDFDENTGGGCCFFFRKVNVRENMPADAIRRNQISKKLGDISKTIRFVSMNSGVISLESLFKRFLPVAVEITKALAHKTVKSRERALLAATFDDHVDEFDLILIFQCSGNVPLDLLGYRSSSVYGNILHNPLMTLSSDRWFDEG
jgi:hypothetical protein